MLETIEFRLFELAIIIVSNLYVFTFHFSGVMSFFSGLIMPTIYFDKPEKAEQDTVLRRALIAFSFLLFFLGTISNFTVPMIVSSVQRIHLEQVSSLHYPFSAYFNLPLFIVGIGMHFFMRRELAPFINASKQKMTKKTKMARDGRTDVRTVKEFLPKTLDYDPEIYIDLSKGVFIGLDRERNPQYIPLEALQKQHADIIGTTGAGKGVIVGLIFYQLILAGEGTFVLDPKDDEWAPHLMKYACEKAGKPFYLINLNKQVPQLDLLDNTTSDQIEELMVAGFSFAEKGDLADFYRIDDRKAAREAPKNASEYERKTFKNLFNSPYVQGVKDTIKAFYGKLEEISLVESVNAIDGMKLQDIFDNGGCCYIIGSMRNSKILITQKMILIRLYQIAETRDRISSKPRPIAIFLDELKYHISKPAMEGLGAMRDKGVHIFLAHQSVADLKECPADLNGDAVVGSVVENTKFKLVYRLQDPVTAEWVSKMSGTILVDDETRYVESNKALSEVVDSKRNIRLAERQFVDTNMLLNLPDGVSYIFTTYDVPKSSLIAHVKIKKSALVTYDEIMAITNNSEHHEQEEPEILSEPEEQSTSDEPNDLMQFEELDLDSFQTQIQTEPTPTPTPTLTAEEEQAQLELLEKQIEGL